MGWMERNAKGRERAHVLVGGVKAFMIGAVLTAAGGWPIYSDTVHQLTGKPATATLIEHIKECTIEYQKIGEERRKEPMDCQAAEALQQLIGSNKIKVSQDLFARVRFSLADGRTHEAKVEESKLGSHKLPVGTEFPVVYAPDRPSDVRAVLTWERLKIPFMLFAAGLVFLLIVFAGSISALVAWAFPRRPSPADNTLSPTVVVVSNRGASPTMGSESRASFGRRK